MAEHGWQAARIDELEALPVLGGELTWHPVRRFFDIRSFGINAYTADEAGRLVVEEHAESGGHEELYFVATGSATFTLDGEQLSAPAGTFVHLRPGTKRVAVADGPGTTVLAIGAKEGEVFTPSPWEGTFAAFGYFTAGDADRARTEMTANIAAHPDAWEGPYNLACLEALSGNTDAAVDALTRAVELGGSDVVRRAAADPDFDGLRDDPRFPTEDS